VGGVGLHIVGVARIVDNDGASLRSVDTSVIQLVGCWCSFIPLVVRSSDSLTPAAEKMEGCYLYFDGEEAVWIRSGKVCGRTFAERHKEHKKSSELKCETSRQSRFYTHYPSKTATAAPVRSRRGFFDDLSMYCGLAFDRGPSLHFLQDDENGIFRWDKDCLNSLLKVKILGTVTLNDKKLHMVAYLCELVYDLMIAPGANLSTREVLLTRRSKVRFENIPKVMTIYVF
jgi:hypothetical protein